MSRSKCDVYRSLPTIFSGTGVDFTQTYAFAYDYAISYDFEIFKGMSHNLPGNIKLSENVWFVGVYKRNESATEIRARTVLKGVADTLSRYMSSIG